MIFMQSDHGRANIITARSLKVNSAEFESVNTFIYKLDRCIYKSNVHVKSVTGR